jgi:hypothetical protein
VVSRERNGSAKKPGPVVLRGSLPELLDSPAAGG